jgi:HEPN domain-containing protein
MSDPRDEARRWLASARDDLDAARLVAREGKHALACFLSQQSAEKAVKAMHYQQGARRVLGHSVLGLIEKLSPRVPELDALTDIAVELDLLYVPTRYPNGLPAGTPQEVFGAAHSTRAIESAARIIEGSSAAA